MTIATFAMACILLSLVLQVVSLFRRKPRNPVVVVLNVAAAAMMFIEIVVRSIELRFFALLGTYDSLIFYSGLLLTLAAAYDVQKRYEPVAGVRFGITILGLALAALASSPLIDSVLRPPVPVLRSGWLVAHVALSFVGEAFFAFAFVTSLLRLLRRDQAELYDRLTYAGIMVGYPIFTLGALVFGAVWAEYAWGSWWSWDPKETWALVTWIVYTIYLHLRLSGRAAGRKLAVVSVVGFLCTLFTFFGVNFLLSGLHSYR